MRKHFRGRAAIEPIIGHLKQDHRLSCNYLKGREGDEINTLLAACAFNIKNFLTRLKNRLGNFVLYHLGEVYEVFIGSSGLKPKVRFCA